MTGLIGRDYCFRHAGSIVRSFGFGVFLGTLASTRKTLLERAVAHYESRGYAFPGHVGRAYRLAALIEARVARIYGRLAERFAGEPEAAALFRELAQEELEHSRLMQLCRFLVVLHPRLEFVPAIRDPQIRAIRAELRALERRIDSMTLDQALDAAVAVEQGEINAVFERLLRQVDSEATRLFEGRLDEVQGHAKSVPRRVALLRRRLAAR
ncbi:MAG: hypothetical protein AB7U81_13680 [Thiohalomonadaceae bacterium]